MLMQGVGKIQDPGSYSVRCNAIQKVHRYSVISYVGDFFIFQPFINNKTKLSSTWGTVSRLWEYRVGCACTHLARELSKSPVGSRHFTGMKGLPWMAA